jgi:RHS repeat-associated protein
MAATSIEQGSAQPNKKHPLELYFIHNDHLGTPNKITDAAQRIVWSMEQTPFGEVDLTTEALQMPMRFPGQYADLESGLNYNYFRDFDSSIGRYVQSDPIGLNGGVNTYGYVGGNPNRFSDPTGRFGIVGAGIGFVTSAASAFQAAIVAGKSNDDALRVAAIFGAVGAVAGGFAGPVGVKESAALGAAFAGSTNLVTSFALTGTVSPISQIKATLFGAINAAIGNVAAFRSSLLLVKASKNSSSAVAMGTGLGSSVAAMLATLEDYALGFASTLFEGECK